MNALQTAILAEGWAWKARQCRETVSNGGNCIDDVHRAYDGTVRREAYCAKFAWVVINEACRKLGVKNPLPKTAGARDMRDRAKKVLRVDSTPAPGAVFYRFSTAAGATGHIGIVMEPQADKLLTVEGNNSDRIDFFTYSWSAVRNSANGWVFIHVEDCPGCPLEVLNAGNSSLLGLAMLATAGYFLYKEIR